MKRSFTLLAFLLAIVVAAKANPVDVQQARQVAANYVNANLATRVASGNDLQLVSTYRTSNGTAAFYVFNMSEGFVIVAADDCATPILGYSEKGRFDETNLPPALEDYLMGFVEQIEYGIESRLPALDTVAHQWELVQTTGLLRDDRATATAVLPLLSTTWDQGCYYNSFCPVDANSTHCGRVLTGCVATAMGQIMRYWRYPQTGTGSHSYTPSTHPEYGVQYVNYATATYDWNNMPNGLSSSSSTAQNNAVGRLLYHCGVSVDMNYKPTSSGATTSDAVYALKTYFKYSPELHYDERSGFSDSQWISKLKNEINQGRPVLYRGRKPDDSAGHAFVCDGYDSNDHLHFNWGWSGSYQSDYYVLDALTPGSHNYSAYNAAIFEIHPLCETSDTRSLPYFDGFEGGETEWHCMNKVDYVNSSNSYASKWSTYAGGDLVNPYTDKVCAVRPFNSTSAGDCSDWLFTPPILLSPNHPVLTLRTYEQYSYDYTYEAVAVYYSSTNTYYQLWTQNSPSASWKNVTIDLSAYAGQEIQIAFIYEGANGHSWYIDDVSIDDDWEPCSSSALPFSDYFTYDIDDCWYIIDGDGSGGARCWQWYNETHSAYHPSGQQNKPQVGWLISKRLFLQPNRDATTLTFYAASTDISGSGRKNSVWIAVDKPEGTLSPSDFTQIWVDPDYSSTWTQYTISLKAYQGHNVNIAFKYEGTYAHNWFVDDVSITESWSPCETVTPAYVQTFNASLGSCWYVIDSDMSGDLRCWRHDETNQCVYHYWGPSSSPQEGWLFSRKVSLPSDHAYKLTFKSKCDSSGQGRKSSVWIAVDKSGAPNPSDYTQIWVDPSYSSSWTTYEIDLSAYSGHAVNIAFKYEGTNAHKWSIDDFIISQIPTYTITASAYPTAGGTVSGGGTYNEGASVTLTATASTGYNFVNWTKNGSVVSTSPTYSFTASASGYYVANFQAYTYSVYVIVNNTSYGSATGEGSYAYGSTVTLTATPYTGYHFVEWVKNGTQVSTNSTYSFTMTYETAGTYTARFAADSHTITATANSTAGGSVTGGGDYDYGATCTLTATPNTGYHFLTWTESGSVVSTNATYNFTVSGDRNLVANFSPNGGSVGCGIVFDLVDSYGDSWNGNYLVVNYGSITEMLTVESGWTSTYTLHIPSGNHVTLSWINGSYTDECSFTVSYEGGNEIYQSSSSSLGASFSYAFDVFCGGSGDGQISNFTSGWNWYSTYIEQSSINGLQMLENALGTNGVQIKSQQQYVNYYEGMGWMGMLSSINNESTYKIKTNAACMVSMEGAETTSSSHPITIGSGWNWIGYPVSTGMSVATAFSDITPTNGDQVKGQDGYANYYEGMGWMGTLSTITPGMGLLYKSNSSVSFTLTYPTGSKGEILAENITAENNHWVPDMHAYSDNMTVTAVVELDDEELNSENYELAAFANGECRGSVKLMYIEPLNRHIAFLTVAGEGTETLSFGLYNTQTGEEIHDAEEWINFNNNATLGDLRTPYVIHFRGLTGTEEWANNIHVFPNPVARGEMVRLGMTGEELGKVQIEIINALGMVETQSVASQQTITAPMVAGVYTLRITVEGKGTCYRKLVVR